MPSKKDKEKLDNTKVPDINLKRAFKLLRNGDTKGADEAYDRFKEGVGRFKKDK